jgi:hypothetical protein
VLEHFGAAWRCIYEGCKRSSRIFHLVSGKSFDKKVRKISFNL